MSDFDEEAEREKLRRKYERDQRKREATEKMSELLLQGATMTNAHCNRCGSPVFRQDDTEFCPTCEQPVAEIEGEEGEKGEEGEGSETAGADESADGVDASADASADAAPEADASVDETDGDDDAGTAAATGEGTVARATATDRSASPDRPAESPPTGSPPAGDLETARASLVRSVVRFARAAEGADDPRRAQEHLAACREAAEALSALR